MEGGSNVSDKVEVQIAFSAETMEGGKKNETIGSIGIGAEHLVQDLDEPKKSLKMLTDEKGAITISTEEFTSDLEAPVIEPLPSGFFELRTKDGQVFKLLDVDNKKKK